MKFALFNIIRQLYSKIFFFCSSLQQEAFAKHNLSITPGSKLVLLSDLKTCLYQLKRLLMEPEKLKEKHYDIGPSELPLSKRWCGTARECWACHHSFLHWQCFFLSFFNIQFCVIQQPNEFLLNLVIIIIIYHIIVVLLLST